MINRIRAIRKEKGMTLADLADACTPPTTPQTTASPVTQPVTAPAAQPQPVVATAANPSAELKIYDTTSQPIGQLLGGLHPGSILVVVGSDDQPTDAERDLKAL